MTLISAATLSELEQQIAAELPGGTDGYIVEKYHDSTDESVPYKAVIKDRPFFSGGVFQTEQWLNRIVRQEREKKFAEVEHLYNSANFSRLANQEEWLAYNQSLKDVPQTLEAMNPTAPIEIPWPEKPEVVWL